MPAKPVAEAQLYCKFSMASVDTPLRSAPPHTHGHTHSHAHDAPATRPPLTLLTSGLAYRLGTAAALAALLWAVVRWALT